MIQVMDVHVTCVMLKFKNTTNYHKQLFIDQMVRILYLFTP